MALKGTTVIELTNVKTGEKERYVEHNLITKALEYLYQPIPNLKMAVHGLVTSYLNYDAHGYEPPFYSLLGGIVLWDKNIAESNEIIAQPHGVKMVGCAAYKQVNTTTSPCRGSYNAAESYFTDSSVERSMKFVYDFSTNQANGIINCVSLTSWQGGYNGFGGNDDISDKSGGFNQYGSEHGNIMATPYAMYRLTSGNVIFIDPAEDVFYEVTAVTTASVTIAKCRANLRQRSMFKDIYHVHDVLETITVDLPTTLSTASSYILNYDVDHDVLYITIGPGSSFSTNTTFYVVAVDMGTYSATVYTLKNNTPINFYLDRAYVRCYDGNLYYAYASSTSVYVIRLSDGVRTSINVPSGAVSNQYCRIYVANGVIYFQAQKTANSSTYYSMACIDPSTKTVRNIGSSYPPNPLYSDSGAALLIPIKGHPLTYYAQKRTYTTNAYRYWGNLWFNPNYLATINNLARPIEKTSDKTMKITYTIQEM